MARALPAMPTGLLAATIAAALEVDDPAPRVVVQSLVVAWQASIIAGYVIAVCRRLELVQLHHRVHLLVEMVVDCVDGIHRGLLE